VTRGWCPGVYEPMASGDGLLVRVKPFGGRVPADALRALAAASTAFGNGVVELTSRGNIQLRGLSAASAPRFAAAMVAAGLADPDPVRERRRNVVTAPPCDDALVAAVENVLAELPGMAPKFCVGFGWDDADIVVGEDGLSVNGTPCARDAVPETIRRLARAANGRRVRDPARRMAKPRHGAGFTALPFGQTGAETLARLAERVAEVRTTPWRAFHLAGFADIAGLGFITDPADPRLTLAACPGAPSCASGTVSTRADAAFLAARGILGVHVSGCAKGCAHARATRTLVGNAGRYDLVQHGRAGDAPDHTGLTIAQAAALLA
jgi:precorrin-3B synthase